MPLITLHKQILLSTHKIVLLAKNRNILKDPDNTYYDAEKAKEDAVNILWNVAGATSNMVNYLIDHELLPDAEQHYAFSQQSTHGQRLADMNFYMRYNRRSKY